MEHPKTALITGASTGIGRALADVFAEHGFDLVLVARSRDKLEALAERLQGLHGIQAAVVAADLTQAAAPQAVFDEVQRQGRAVDVLVNNAGVNAIGPFQDLALEAQLELLKLNVLAVTALTHLFLPPMLKRASGRILNIASLAAFGPLPRVAVYAASKAYVLSLTEALAVELAGSGVSITALCPGPVDTAMMEKWSTAASRWTDVPPFLMLKPEAVAREGFAACMDGKVVQISGLASQITSSWMKFSPRWLVRNTAGLLTRWAK